MHRSVLPDEPSAVDHAQFWVEQLKGTGAPAVLRTGDHMIAVAETILRAAEIPHATGAQVLDACARYGSYAGMLAANAVGEACQPDSTVAPEEVVVTWTRSAMLDGLLLGLALSAGLSAPVPTPNPEA